MGLVASANAGSWRSTSTVVTIVVTCRPSPPIGQLVHQALGDHVPHARLGVGDTELQRDRVELMLGQLHAPQDVAHLGAVAVRDHRLEALDDGRGQQL